MVAVTARTKTSAWASVVHCLQDKRYVNRPFPRGAQENGIGWKRDRYEKQRRPAVRSESAVYHALLLGGGLGHVAGATWRSYGHALNFAAEEGSLT